MTKRQHLRRSLVGGVVLVILVAIPAAAGLSRFADVSDDNIFIGDIEWLADAGVTKGCNPDGTLFCPEDPVTRQQMAAFMRRLATNQVVDAGTLDGIDSTAFATNTHNHDTNYLGLTDQATDSDQLDGLDSTAFATNTHNHDTNYLGLTDQATDSAQLAGRAPETYDTFVIGFARAAADQSGYLAICTVEQLPGCPAPSVSSEGVLLAEVTFDTLTADSTVAVTAMTGLSSLASIDTFDSYIWLQLDSSACTDSINAQGTGAYTRQTFSPGHIENIAVTAAFEIPTAGTHSVALCAQPFGGNVGVLSSTITGVVSASPASQTTIDMVPS